jgi:hypothetical protein
VIGDTSSDEERFDSLVQQPQQRRERSDEAEPKFASLFDKVLKEFKLAVEHRA